MFTFHGMPHAAAAGRHKLATTCIGRRRSTHQYLRVPGRFPRSSLALKEEEQRGCERPQAGVKGSNNKRAAVPGSLPGTAYPAEPASVPCMHTGRT